MHYAFCLQAPIFELLRKFDGQRVHDDIKAGRRRYRLTRLPAHLVLHVKRFSKNNFFTEKNPTIVNFPVKNLQLKDVVPVPTGRVGLCHLIQEQFASHLPLECIRSLAVLQ